LRKWCPTFWKCFYISWHFLGDEFGAEDRRWKKSKLERRPRRPRQRIKKSRKSQRITKSVFQVFVTDVNFFFRFHGIT
jgi:hypothetical protein